MRYSYELFLTELGAKLRQMRQERGWTFRHMIVAHGFHLAHWQGFEKGKGISLPSLLRVCEVFDIPVEQLIAGMGVLAPGAELPKRVSGSASEPTTAVSEEMVTSARTPATSLQRSPRAKPASPGPKSRR